MEFLKDWHGKRVLVTGGSGFIGRHVVRLGREAGVDVRSSSLHGPELPLDITNGGAVLQLIEQVRPEGVIHLTSAGVSYGTTAFSEMLQVNVIGLDNLLTAIAAQPCPIRTVVAGTGYEYAPQDRPVREEDPVGPRSPYATTKSAAALVAAYHAQRIPITLLRVSNAYGPGEREPRLIPFVIGRTKRGEAAAISSGEQVRDLVYVEDAAESFWRTLAMPNEERGLQVINVGTGTAILLREVLALLEEALKEHGLVPRLNWGVVPIRADEPKIFVTDISRMRELLRWAPTTTLKDGLRMTVEAALNAPMGATC